MIEAARSPRAQSSVGVARFLGLLAAAWSLGALVAVMAVSPRPIGLASGPFPVALIASFAGSGLLLALLATEHPGRGRILARRVLAVVLAAGNALGAIAEIALERGALGPAGVDPGGPLVATLLPNVVLWAAIFALTLAMLLLDLGGRAKPFLADALGIGALAAAIFLLIHGIVLPAGPPLPRQLVPQHLAAAAGLLLLAVGTPLSRPHLGSMRVLLGGGDEGRLLRVRVGTALLVPPVCGALAIHLIHRQIAAPAIVVAAVAAIAAGSALALVLASDAGLRRLERRRESERRRYEEQHGRLALIQHVGDVLAVTTRLDEALQRSLEAIAGHFDLAVAAVWAMRPGVGMELVAHAGPLPPSYRGPEARPLCADPASGPAAFEHTGGGVLVFDLPDQSTRTWAQALALKSFAAHALAVDGAIEGLVEVCSRAPSIAPVLEAIGPIANDLALAIRNRRAERSLHESELRARAVLDSMLEGVLEVDADGIIFGSNPAADAILGVPPHLLHGLRVGDVIAAQDDGAPGRPRFDGDGLRRMCGQRGQGEAMRPDGVRVPIEVVVGRIDNGFGERFTMLVTDLTERHRLEQRLRHAQKMEAIGRLAGGVAHDFNNLLTVILGHTDLAALRVEESSDVGASLREVLAAVERARGLTRQLLAFSRQQVMQPRRLDLNEAVVSMQRMLRRVIGEDIQLEIDCAARPAVAFVDPSQFDQVLLNLVVNARDAMPAGGHLALQTGTLDVGDDLVHQGVAPRAGRYVRVTVADSGCGMDPETLAHIFEPFFTTKSPGDGTGLGLATVHGIVEQSGGFVQVQSEPGRGSRFHVHFPLDASEAADGAGGGPSPPQRAARGETVLLVEDDDAVREVTRRMLASSGYRVLVARGAAAALDVLDAHPDRVHLVLTDMVMPDMSGRDLAEAIRARLNPPRILFASGYASDHLRGRQLSPGEHFLEKPFSADALAAKVREALDRAGRGGPPEEVDRA